jgi:cytochrome P450
MLLPARCEVIVSPFAEHRRHEVFAEPDRLRPRRWSDSQLETFPFMPFGGGARACLGRRIALATLERSTAALLATVEPTLTHPQRLDWRMNVTLAPVPDPLIRLRPARRCGTPRPKLSGPASNLIQ